MHCHHTFAPLRAALTSWAQNRHACGGAPVTAFLSPACSFVRNGGVTKSIAADEEEKGMPKMAVLEVRVVLNRLRRSSGVFLASHSFHIRRCTRASAKIQNDLRILTERLARINDNLARKVSSRTEYDKTITETEAAYSKIMESSQTLLHVLKRESVNLTKKKQASS